MLDHTKPSRMALFAVVLIVAAVAANLVWYGGTNQFVVDGGKPGPGLLPDGTAWPGLEAAVSAGMPGHAHAEQNQQVTGGLDLVASIHDGTDGFTGLHHPRSVATFQMGRNTYAAIAASDDGVQIVDVTNPSNPSAIAHLRDSDTRELDGARDIKIFEISGKTYAIVGGSRDNGVQIVDVTDPRQPVAAGRITDEYLKESYRQHYRTQITPDFHNPLGVAIFERGGDLYAIVTATDEIAVQIFNITDPLNPTPAGHMQDDDNLELRGALGVDTFEIDGGTYAIVVGHRDDGVQIVNVTDPHAPVAAGSVADNANLELYHATGVTIFKSGNSTYAAVAGYEDYGMQIIDVTDPLNPAPAGSVTKVSDTLGYSTASQVDIFYAGGGTYAVVTSFNGGYIYLVDLTDPYNPANLAYIQTPYRMGNGGYGVDVFETGGGLYAITTAYKSNYAHILQISMTVDRPPWVAVNLQPFVSIPAGSAYEDAGATCTDEAEGDLTGQVLTASNVDTAVPGTYAVTYTCADTAGNEATATRTVVVTTPPAPLPVGAPVIDVIGATPAEVAVGDAYADAGATCTDEDYGDLTDKIRIASDVNVYAHGNYTVTYRCADSEDNEATATRTVTVTDADAPSISRTGHSPAKIYVGDAYADAGATCMDRVEGDLTDSMTITGSVDTSAAGSYTITYSCADSVGNAAADASRTVIVLDPVSVIADGVGNFTELEGAYGVEIFESGNSTYAIVTGSHDDGVQIIDVTDPNRPAAAGSISDSAVLELEGAYGVEIFESGNSTYAIVTGFYDDGVQIIDVTDPFNLAAAGSISDGAGLKLDGASDVEVFERGGSTYAIVASYTDDGVQIIDVTDPFNPAAAGSISDSAVLELDGAYGVEIFERGGSTYAIVVGHEDNGIQIIDVTDPANPTAMGHLSDSRRHHLNGPTDVAVFERDGSTYAIVTALYDDGVHVINVTDPANPTAEGRKTYDPSYLDGLYGVTVFWDGDSTYAIIMQGLLDGVRIVDITDPSKLVNKKVIYDNAILRLDGANDAATFKIDGITYAIVTARDDDGALIMPVAASAAARAPPVIALNGTSPVQVPAGSAYVDAGATCTDETEGDLTDLMQVIPTVDTAVSGNYAVTYMCTDSMGNEATAVREVRVVDAQQPAFTAPALNVPVEDSPPPPPPNTVVLEPRGSRDIGRITLTSSVPGTIHASWEEPSEDPANYRISWAKVGDDFLAWIDQTGNAFPTEPRHTITGLEGGEEYKVMVRASYDGTAGDWSGEVTITVAEPPGNSQSVEDPPPPPPPNTVVLEPTGPLGPRDIGRITLTSSVPGTIHASWEEPSEDPANYRISWAKVGDDFLAWIDQTGNAFPTEPRHTITGLEGGEEYKVMVRASYDGTAGDWSGEVTITVAEPPGNSQSVEDPPPPPPSNTVVLEPTGPLGPRDIGRITLTSSVPGTIHASWEEPSEDPANYRISWAKVGDDFLTWIDQTGNAFPTEPRHTITGLEGGEEYKVMVRASYDGTAGDWSGEVTITVAEPPGNSQSVEDPPPPPPPNTVVLEPTGPLGPRDIY